MSNELILKFSRDNFKKLLFLFILFFLGIGNFNYLKDNIKNNIILECIINANNLCEKNWEDKRLFDETNCQRNSLRNEAILMIYRGDHTSASALLEKIIPCFKKDASLKYWLGLANYKSGLIEEALTTWDEIRAVAPLVILAKENNLNDSNEAELLFNLAYRIAQEYPEEYNFVYLEYANFLLDKSNGRASEDVIRLFKRAVEINPMDVSSYISLSKIYSQRGENSLAEKWLIDAQNVAPQDSTVQLAFANLYLKWQMYDQAIIHAQEAKALDPKNGWVYITLGRALYWKGEYQTALDYLDEVNMYRDPNIQFRAYVTIGDIYFKLGNCDKSLEAYMNAKYEIDISNQAYHDYIENQLKMLSCEKE